MDLIHRFLNMVAPPIALIILCVALPPLFLLRFIRSIIGSFTSECMIGKVVLITGASSGIGEHLAYEYAKKGAFLILVARREKKLREVAAKVCQIGSPGVLIVPADVSIADECKRFVEESVKRFGRLDHLVCNAGIVSYCKFEESLDLSNFKAVMDVNFWGSIYPTYYAIPYLRKSRGKIIVNTSGTGWLMSPLASLYGASKAALINFYETLRIELGSDVKITIAAPGFTESEIVTQGKHLTKEGAVVEVDKGMTDALVGTVPVQSAGDCAKGIVDGACRGDRYVIKPSWSKPFFWVKFVSPDIAERGAHWLFMRKRGTF